MAQDYGAAQPLMDLVNRYHDNISKVIDMIPSFGVKPVADKSAGSSTDSGKLPDEWEEANRKSVQQQLAPANKPLSQRTLGGAKKTPARTVTNKAAARKTP